MGGGFNDCSDVKKIYIQLDQQQQIVLTKTLLNLARSSVPHTQPSEESGGNERTLKLAAWRREHFLLDGNQSK